MGFKDQYLLFKALVMLFDALIKSIVLYGAQFGAN